MTNAEAWRLLKDKFGLIHVLGKYYLPPRAKPVASSTSSPGEDNKHVAASLAGLRKNLCAYGVPMCVTATSRKTAPSWEERVGLARWVRYAHVDGLSDGQTVDPDDLGESFGKFLAGWKVLCDHFGCRYSSGKYVVPTSPTGEGKEMFEGCGLRLNVMLMASLKGRHVRRRAGRC